MSFCRSHVLVISVRDDQNIVSPELVARGPQVSYFLSLTKSTPSAAARKFSKHIFVLFKHLVCITLFDTVLDQPNVFHQSS